MHGSSIEKVVDPGEEDKQMPSDTTELLCIYQTLNDLPFSKIKMLAQGGKLNSKLAHATPRMCSACTYGKATCKPWRYKPRKGDVKKTAT
jgi:hypothetical protein